MSQMTEMHTLKDGKLKRKGSQRVVIASVMCSLCIVLAVGVGVVGTFNVWYHSGRANTLPVVPTQGNDNIFGAKSVSNTDYKNPSSGCSSNTPVSRSTPLGPVVGRVIENNLVEQFVGIPYAKPPIGNLRWRPPRPISAWKKPVQALKFTPACNQFPTSLYPNLTVSEDCLHLNVWRPHTKHLESYEKKLLPVFFWIHGGGLRRGTAMAPRFNFSRFARRHDIVVVSINYRLGIMAYLIDPTNVIPYVTNGGSNGLLDMIEALKWVQQNIVAFGGDPKKVTIAGQSGGAWAVCFLTVSPAAKGLFRRAIQQSGGCSKPTGLGFHLLRKEGELQTQRILDHFSAPSVDSLRGTPAQTLIRSLGNIFFMPSVDGIFFQKDVLIDELFKNGVSFHPEALMVGTMYRDNLIGFSTVVSFYPTKPNEFSQYLQLYMNATEAKLLSEAYPIERDSLDPYYPSHFKSTTAFVWSQMITDVLFRCGVLREIEYLSKSLFQRKVNENSAKRIYFYQFGGAYPPWDAMSHSGDMNFVFLNKNVASFWAKYYVQLLANDMSDLWARFIEHDDLEMIFEDDIWAPLLESTNRSRTPKFLLGFGVPMNRDYRTLSHMVSRCHVWDGIRDSVRENILFLFSLRQL